VLREWLTAVNPLASPRIDRDGQLRFENVAELAGVAESISQYDVRWFLLDNETGVRSPLGDAASTARRVLRVPAALDGASYAGVEVRTRHPHFPSWRDPVRFYLRREGSAWRPVGVERAALVEEPGRQFASR
jgi:hypothetical protein